jgi:hypothetical protein
VALAEWSKLFIPPVNVADMAELVDTLKYINSGDAHPDEIREGVREALDNFDKKRPDVLDALDDSDLDEDEENDVVTTLMVEEMGLPPTANRGNLFDGLYEELPCGHIVLNFQSPLLLQASDRLKAYHGIDPDADVQKDAAKEREYHLSRKCLEHNPPLNSKGRCSVCDLMPYLCECWDEGPEPDREALKNVPKDAVPKWARCTSCAEPYPIWPDRGRRCMKCGHAPVEILDLDPAELKVIHTDGMVPCYVNHEFWMLPNVVTYADVLEAAGYKPERIISVTYHGKRMKRATELEWRKPGEPVSMEPNWVRVEGILSPGKEVAACPGMVFNAADTSNA